MAMLVGVVLGMLITVVRAPFFRVSVLLHPSAKGARGRGAAKELCCASLLFVSEKRWTAPSWVSAPELPRLRCLQRRYMVHHLKLAKGLQFFPLSAQNRLRVAAFAMYWALPCRRMGGVV